MRPRQVTRCLLVHGALGSLLGMVACGDPAQPGEPSDNSPAASLPNSTATVPNVDSTAPGPVAPGSPTGPNADGPGPADSGPSGNAGAANGPDVEGDDDVTPDEDPELPPDEPTAARLRRLTHIEYNNTIADLLGDMSNPASSFTADTAQDGFTNNASSQSVSPALTEQYMAAAEALSVAATEDLVGLLGCDPVATAEQACVEGFVRDFGKRAWRRPLTDVEQARLLAVFTEARAEFEVDVAVQLVIRVLLQSPQFIYLLEPAEPGAAPGTVAPLNSWQVATRLSYFLLGSMPDPELFAAAEADALSTPEQVGEQARRLLSSSRARARIGLFFKEWMQLRNMDRMQKDPGMFPEYDLTLGPLLGEQVERFAQAVILDEGGTAMDLLTAPYTFVTPELAPFYDLAAPTESGFTRVELDPAKRRGLLTQAGVMASLAKADQTDPVHRGKFVRERLLCQSIPPPPPDAVITPPAISPDATTRERFNQHQEDPTCAQCHVLMDPIGLGFENYDPLGQWRDDENGFPVDSSGEIIGSDVAGTFNGAPELVTKLADSREVMECMAETWLRFALGRSITDEDAGSVAALTEDFESSGFIMTELLVSLAQSRTFRHQWVPDPDLSAFAQEEQ